MGEEPSLLEAFRSTKFKATRCVVCAEVSLEVREVIEDGLRRGLGSVGISNWLRGRDLWSWSNAPIETHRGHMK